MCGEAVLQNKTVHTVPVALEVSDGPNQLIPSPAGFDIREDGGDGYPGMDPLQILSVFQTF